MGALRCWAPSDPWKLALPKANTPPSTPDNSSPCWPAWGSPSCSVSVAKVVSLFPRLVRAKPTAKHPPTLVQPTPFRYPNAVTSGLDSTDQAEPFHASMSGDVPEFSKFPLDSDAAPVAQQSAAPRQVTSVSSWPAVEGSALGTVDHLDPSHRSTRVEAGLPSAPMTDPTAQQLLAEVQVTLLR